jgi:membrane-associated HD superfamily phosphohydrolase
MRDFMLTSIVFAKGFGIYLIIVAVALAIQYKYFHDAMSAFLKKPALVLMSSIFTLFIGAFLVAAHNIWVAQWIVVVTILCWLTLIKGAVRLLVPDIDRMFMNIYGSYISNLIVAIICLIVGIFLLYKGINPGVMTGEYDANFRFFFSGS